MGAPGSKIIVADFVAGAGPKNAADLSLNAFPHQFSLQDISTKSHICSVTLIHPLLLLTAAHCVFGKQLGGMRAVTGNHHELDPHKSNGTGESRGILQAILHPKYDNVTMDNDIALLRLDRPAPTSYNGSTIVATLPQPNWSYNNRGILTGWGLNSASAQPEDTFGVEERDIEQHSDCVETYDDGSNPWNRKATENMLCAWYSGSDSCKEIETAAVLICEKGDSGEAYICGIGSWGYGCGSEHDPMIFTNVSKYRSWISKEMRKIRRNSRS